MATALRLEAVLNDPADVEQVERLRAVLNTGNAELIRNSLQLMDWCVAQVRQGRHITSVTEDGKMREFDMPVLERARMISQLPVSDEAYTRILGLIESPPAPTAALRELFARPRAVTAR
jgi:hypothetical protein